MIVAVLRPNGKVDRIACVLDEISEAIARSGGGAFLFYANDESEFAWKLAQEEKRSRPDWQ